MTVEINGREFATGDWLALLKADGELAPDGPTPLIDAYMSAPYDDAEMRAALKLIRDQGSGDAPDIAKAVLAALHRD